LIQDNGEFMKIGIFYFSATGVTETITNHISKTLEKEGISVTQVNIIVPDNRQSQINFLDFDACMFGFPVFGGRLPSVADEWMSTLDGKNQKCSMFFTYGARDLEWAHQVTFHLLSQANFRVVLSAEFIGSHSFNVAEGFNLAEDRPNELDINVAEEFAKYSISRFQTDSEFVIDLSNFTYKPVSIKEKTGAWAKLYPSRGGADCSMCLLCEKECPVKAFDADSGETNRNLCITCMHCVKFCPDEVIHVEEISQLFKDFMERTGLSKEIVDNKRSKIIF